MTGEELVKKLKERRAQINNDAEIKEVEKLIKTEDRFYKNYFIADNFECLELGIVSKKSKVGMDMLKKLRML